MMTRTARIQLEKDMWYLVAAFIRSISGSGSRHEQPQDSN